MSCKILFISNEGVSMILSKQGCKRYAVSLKGCKELFARGVFLSIQMFERYGVSRRMNQCSDCRSRHRRGCRYRGGRLDIGKDRGRDGNTVYRGIEMV